MGSASEAVEPWNRKPDVRASVVAVVTPHESIVPGAALVTVAASLIWLATSWHVFSADAGTPDWMLEVPSLPTPLLVPLGALLLAWTSRRAGRPAVREVARWTCVLAPIAVVHSWGVRMSGLGPSVFGVQSFFDRLASGRMTTLWILLLICSLVFPLLAMLRGVVVGLRRWATLWFQLAIVSAYLPLVVADAMLLVYAVRTGELAASHGAVLRALAACATAVVTVLDYRSSQPRIRPA